MVVLVEAVYWLRQCMELDVLVEAVELVEATTLWHQYTFSNDIHMLCFSINFIKYVQWSWFLAFLH